MVKFNKKLIVKGLKLLGLIGSSIVLIISDFCIFMGPSEALLIYSIFVLSLFGMVNEVLVSRKRKPFADSFWVSSVLYVCLFTVVINTATNLIINAYYLNPSLVSVANKYGLIYNKPSYNIFSGGISGNVINSEDINLTIKIERNARFKYRTEFNAVFIKKRHEFNSNEIIGEWAVSRKTNEVKVTLFRKAINVKDLRKGIELLLE